MPPIRGGPRVFSGEMPNIGEQKISRNNWTMEEYGYTNTNSQYYVQRKKYLKTANMTHLDVMLRSSWCVVCPTGIEFLTPTSKWANQHMS